MFALAGGANDRIPYTIFTICGTIWVYNLHRTVGLKLTQRQKWPERFRIFYQLRYLNVLISLVTMIMALWIFFQFLLEEWWMLLPPIVVSLLYVFPLSTKKIVRSIPYLKIFLISFTWAWMTVIIPAWMSGVSPDILIWVLFAERFIFIMAIDIPFDIRDYEQDAHQSVDTLVHHLGVSSSKWLSYFLLLISTIIALLTFAQFWMILLYSIAHLMVYILAFVLVRNVHKGRSDLYYTFGLDGTMLLMGMLEIGIVVWVS